jgi:hypothetical protein
VSGLSDGTVASRSNVVVLKIPNFFTDKHPLNLKKCGSYTPYYEIKIKPLSAIASASSGVLSGSITNSYLSLNFYKFGPKIEDVVLNSPINEYLDEYYDYTSYAVPSGATSASIKLAFRGDITDLQFYVNDETTGTPLTGIAIYDSHLKTDNNILPITRKEIKVRRAEQTRYYNRSFEANYYSEILSPYVNKDIDLEDNGQCFGSIFLKKFSDVTLEITFASALSHNSTVNIFALGRGIVTYKDGTVSLRTR